MSAPPVPSAVAAYLLRTEVVPTHLSERIVFFTRKADIESLAHKRAKALRLHRRAAEHLKRHQAFRGEAARLKALQHRPVAKPSVPPPVRAPVRYVPPPVRPARYAPPPAAPVFRPSVQKILPDTVSDEGEEEVEEAPAEMDTFSPEGVAEPEAGGWLKIGLLLLGGFAIYKVATRKKKAA